MKYEEIDHHLRIKGLGYGVQNAKQSKLGREEHIDIGGGICRGLVTDWLISKKNGTDFWAVLKKEETTSLLGKQKLIKHAKSSQESYADDHDETWRVLGSVGLTHGTDITYTKGIRAIQNILAGLVFTNRARYSIISLTGSGGGHSVGAYRPWCWFGKSGWVHF